MNLREQLRSVVVELDRVGGRLWEEVRALRGYADPATLGRLEALRREWAAASDAAVDALNRSARPTVAEVPGAAELTPRQRDALQFIINYQHARGISPTMNEIGRGLRISKVAAHELVCYLRAKGCLQHRKHHARALALCRA